MKINILWIFLFLIAKFVGAILSFDNVLHYNYVKNMTVKKGYDPKISP